MTDEKTTDYKNGFNVAIDKAIELIVEYQDDEYTSHQSIWSTLNELKKDLLRKLILI